MATINSSAGIDDCSAGPGACEHNHCAGTCQNNAYQMAWPNYGDCVSAHDCSANTSVPYAGTHQCGNANIEVYQRTCANIAAYPTLKDCGPPPGHFSSGGYCVSRNQEVVACLNTAAFAALCNGCNPGRIGLIGANFTTS